MLSRLDSWWHKLGKSNRTLVALAIFGAVVTILAAVIGPLVTWVLPPRQQSNPPTDTKPRYDSAFIADVTWPDTSTVNPNEIKEKVWRLQNTGQKTWVNFSIKNVESQGLSTVKVYPLPKRVEPGDLVDIKVIFKVIANSGEVYSKWKLVDSNGEFVFPDKQGIFCKGIVQNN